MGYFNILGIGEKKDKYRPYPGYKVCYGSMTLENVRTNGFIPLTAYYLLSSQFCTNDSCHWVDRLVVNGKVVASVSFSNVTDNGIGLAKHSGYWDLDFIYKGDIEQLKGITSIITNKLYNNGNIYETSKPNIVKWLEPISSGGGS